MIKRDAILHNPCSNYAYVSDENTFTIRIRVAKNNLTKCTLWYADRLCMTNPAEFSQLEMNEVASDSYFSYFEVVFLTPYSRICYYFKLEDDEEWTYYYSNIFSKEAPDFVLNGHLIDNRSEYYQYPIILRTEIPQIPEWFKKACIYNIFPDSFATSKGNIANKSGKKYYSPDKPCYSKLGGTIKGITENLDYIQNLGCDCIYLNPVFAARASHKYDTIDYYRIDPCFGSNDDVRELINEVHKRGMHIIFDGVFNHCGMGFFPFQDVMKNGKDSEYSDWFYGLEFPVDPKGKNGLPNYTCFAYEATMPKMNTANPKVQQYFAELCNYWVNEYGIDGWRLDVVNEVTKEFLRVFRKAAREANPECVIIGEVWENAQHWLNYDLLDSAMDYDFRRHVRDYFAFHKIDSQEFNDRITDLRMRYPSDYWRAQLNFLDSHDVTRFLTFCDGNVNCLKQAIAFQMLFPGVPSIFYGDELEMMGTIENEYRAPMAWDKEKSSNLIEFYRQIIKIHKSEIVSKGEYRTVDCAPNQFTYSCSICLDNQLLTAHFNTGNNKQPIINNGTCLLKSNYEDEMLLPDGFVIFMSDTK